MKIHFVFTPNSRGFGTSFESGQPANPCVFIVYFEKFEKFVYF